jgi:hypothetical protein
LVLINAAPLSAGILWGDSNDIQENFKNYMKEFNITLKNLSSLIKKVSQ